MSRTQFHSRALKSLVPEFDLAIVCHPPSLVFYYFLLVYIVTIKIIFLLYILNIICIIHLH